jgi:two-component sensor histidine kinase
LTEALISPVLKLLRCVLEHLVENARCVLRRRFDSTLPILEEQRELADDEISDLIRRVSAMLGHGLGTPAAAEELAHVEVPGDTATAVALIFSELYANAHEHGGGDVRVSLTRQGNTIELVVVDRGPGLPDGFDPERSLGLKIALALATDQLRGELLLEDAAPGVRARLTWSTA